MSNLRLIHADRPRIMNDVYAEQQRAWLRKMQRRARWNTRLEVLGWAALAALVVVLVLT